MKKSSDWEYREKPIRARKMIAIEVLKTQMFSSRASRWRPPRNELLETGRILFWDAVSIQPEMNSNRIKATGIHLFMLKV